MFEQDEPVRASQLLNTVLPFRLYHRKINTWRVSIVPRKSNTCPLSKLLSGLMHAFLMFSSFQTPLQMRLATQLVIIFTLRLLGFLLRAVFSALSSAGCTTAQ